MDEVEKIKDVASLKAFLHGRDENLHDSVVRYYEQLGKKEYDVRIALDSHERPECIWSDPEGRSLYAFEVEFGSRWNVERAVERLWKSEAKMSVLAVSSRARGFSYSDIRSYLINIRMHSTKPRKFLLLDIETGKSQVLTIGMERKKIIKGRRNEHKEQD